MGLMRCFAKHNSMALPAPPVVPPESSTPAAAAATTLPTPSKAKSTKSVTPRKRQVVRAPDRAEASAAPTSPARGFVPRTVAELHPEYAHSEPYHFAANTDSCRMVLSSAQVAARRAGDLRVRAQVVPSPPKPKQVIVRGPQYSARMASPAKSTNATANADPNDGKENSGAASQQQEMREPATPDRKSNVALIVERPRTYLADKNEQPSSDTVSRGFSRKLKSPLFRRAGSKRNITKSASPSPTKAQGPSESRVKPSVSKKSLNMDDAEAEEKSALLESFNSTPKKSDGNVVKPVPMYPEQETAPTTMDESALDPEESDFNFNSDSRRDFIEVPSTFDDAEGVPYNIGRMHHEDMDFEDDEEDAENEDEEASDDDKSRVCPHGCTDCGFYDNDCDEDRTYDEYKHADEYEDDETEDESRRDDEEDEDDAESEQQFGELKQQYLYDRQADGRASNADGESENEPSVSADGFLVEDPTASARSSMRSSIRSSVRSSVRSSMRSCISRYSFDSQYHQSVDGDRVASTFDFMRGNGDEDSSDDEDVAANIGERLADRQDKGSSRMPQDQKMDQIRMPRSPNGSFTSSKSGSQRELDSDSEDGSHRQLRDYGAGARRMDSSLEQLASTTGRLKISPSPVSPSPSPLPRRMAEKREPVDESGRGFSNNLAPIPAPRRKTVSFRPDKPVVIEPNLRERSPAPPAAMPERRKIVSALRTTQKPPTAAEIATKRVEDAERKLAERERKIAEREIELAERASQAEREREALRSQRSMMSPSSSYGSLPTLRQTKVAGAGIPVSSSYNSLPRMSSSNSNSNSRQSRRMSQRVPSDLDKRRSMAVAEAVVKQMSGVPRSIMLAYQNESDCDENDQDASNASLGRNMLRPRARSTKSITVPEVRPGEIPTAPPPPSFRPTDTRVRSVRKAPPPPSPRASVQM